MNHQIILIDMSWSMQGYLGKLLDALNYFVKKMDPASIITVAYFHDYLVYLTKTCRQQDVEIFTRSNFTFGMTGLYDSVCDVIFEFEREGLMNTMYVISDGADNSSRRQTKESADTVCQTAIKSGRWNIIHCSTEVEQLVATHNVKFAIDDLDQMMNSLSM